METDGKVIATVLAIIIAVFGCGFALAGAIATERRLKAVRFGSIFDAVISRYGHAPPEHNALGDTSLRPFVRFDPGDGREYEALFTGPNNAKFRQRNPAGTKTRIRIDPAKPSLAYPANAVLLLLGPLIMLMGGLLAMAISWGIWNGMP